MTIAKRILSMVAALSIISNNSIPMGLINSSGENSSNRGSVENNNRFESDELTTSDEVTTDEQTRSKSVHQNAPEFYCTPHVSNNWVKKLSGWEMLKTDDGASIYFRLSDESFSPEASDIRTGLAASYSGTSDLQQGNKYVCFYAKWNDTEDESKIAISPVLNYKLDKDPPDEFRIGYGTIGYWPYIMPIIRNGSPIKDQVSDIDKIYYSVGTKYEKDNDIQDPKKTKLLDKHNAEGGGYDICIPCTSDILFKNVYVYAYDMSGNLTTSEVLFVNDIDNPVVEYKGACNIIKKTEDKEEYTEEEPFRHEYGDDRVKDNKHTDYTYVSGVSYLKVKVTDSNRDNCKVTVKWGSKDDEFKKFNISELHVPKDIEPEKDVVYIPFSELGLEDSAKHGSYQFTIEASDGCYPAEPCHTDADVFFWYSKSNDGDVISTFNIPGEHKIRPYDFESKLDDSVTAYLFDKTETGNKLIFTLKDDVGIAEYSAHITKDGKEFMPERRVDLRDGIVTKGEDETTGEVVYYSVPKTEIRSEAIDVDQNGTYAVHIELLDFEGNKQTYDHRFIVDTEAPVIKGNDYTVNKELNYTKDGIYANNEFDLTIVPEDDLSGIDPSKVLLKIDDITKRTAELEEGNLVFKGIKDDCCGEISIVIPDKVGNKNTYYFKTVDNNKSVMTGEKLSLNVPTGVVLQVDSTAPQLIRKAVGEKVEIVDREDGSEIPFFGAGEGNYFEFTFKEDKGLRSHNIVFHNDDGSEIDGHGDSEDYTNEEKYPSPVMEAGPVKIPVDMETGRYTIDGSVTNLAGATVNLNNGGTNSKEVFEFYVDKIAPQIESVDFRSSDQDENKKSLMNFTRFGIFGKEKVDLVINAKDNPYGIGVDSATLMWGETLESKDKGYTVKADNNGVIVFKDLAPIRTGVPHLVVRDRLGNENNYYFTANSLNKDPGKIIMEDPENAEEHLSMTLENGDPFVDLIVENKEAVKIGKKIWYVDKADCKVKAYDKGTLMSGLKRVKILNGDKELLNEDEYNGKKFNESKYTDSDPVYSYSIEEEGEYNLKAVAEDNAGNTGEDSKHFYVDNKAPEILDFNIGDNNEEAPFVRDDNYGYFFKDDVTAIVYVKDPGFASGISHVDLCLNEADGNETTWSVDASLLNDEGDGVYSVNFPIRKGFKGYITAKAYDKVGHDSGNQTPDGAIIEDEALHSEHASITITPLGTEKNGFYNHALTLNVSVKDTFSGISDISWSVGKDNKNGHLTASTADMSLYSDYDVEQQIVNTDANLITEVSFKIQVESDVSDNPVEVIMTDNAGNTIQSSAVYSLDLTAPELSTGLGNTDTRNGMYYDKDQSVNLSIVEHNFDPNDAKVLVNGEEQKVSWSGQEGNGDVHTATVNLTKDGDYTVSLEYSDLAGNPGTYTPDQHFIIDKTKPVITNNFADFKTGTADDISGSTELYLNNQDDRKAAFEVNVKDKNFNEEDLNIRVLTKQPGSAHEDKDGEEWYESRPDYNWIHDTSKDSHTLNFELDEDSVYRIEITPVDRAGNTGDIAEGSESSTDIFEVDTTVPVLGSRSEGDYAELTEDKYKALAVYDIDRFEDEAPFVEFNDLNLYRLDYELTSFNPVYSDGREIGKIEPVEKKSEEDYSDYAKDKSLKIQKTESAMSQDTIRYTLPEFEDDGVYSVKLYAVDLAGNKSEISENTYVRMMNTSMLAYIENSSKEEGTGWYSFEDDEYGPISKQPTSFKDLDIVMFSKAGTSPKLLLVDKDTDAETDTYATTVSEKVIDNDMYMVNAERYKLTGDYFATNFTEDTDTRLYLRAENEGEYVDLGEMYIDNTKPECAVPDYLKNWGWLKGSGEQTITFSNISEVLDDGETVVYVNGKEITANGLSTEVDGKIISAAYSVKDDELTVTLPNGSYSIGAKLVDKAGNTRIITEVEHFSVGNSRIWIGAGGAASLIIAVGGISLVARSKRRRASGN